MIMFYDRFCARILSIFVSFSETAYCVAHETTPNNKLMKLISSDVVSP